MHEKIQTRIQAEGIQFALLKENAIKLGGELEEERAIQDELEDDFN